MNRKYIPQTVFGLTQILLSLMYYTIAGPQCTSPTAVSYTKRVVGKKDLVVVVTSSMGLGSPRTDGYLACGIIVVVFDTTWIICAPGGATRVVRVAVVT